MLEQSDVLKAMWNKHKMKLTGQSYMQSSHTQGPVCPVHRTQAVYSCHTISVCHCLIEAKLTGQSYMQSGQAKLAGQSYMQSGHTQGPVCAV